jgi:outer membrane receptor protein involved in Fe transport
MIATLLIVAVAVSQQFAPISGVVTDATGAPLAGAAVAVTFDDSRVAVSSSTDGTWTASIPAGRERVVVRVSSPGFATLERAVELPAGALTFEMRPQAIAETVTVSAEAAPHRIGIESSVTSLDRTTLASAPALRLDDQLRTVPGFSLFRRTSSAVANPTTQGVTLRGLSASGASRTLVVADEVPLNDPFGAWVYWDRVPSAALQRVDVVRGASGDVHGNDALGGVIRITTRTAQGAEAWLDAGSHGSARTSIYGAVSPGAWTAGGAAEYLTTDGYVVIDPAASGPVDVEADSRASSAMAWAGGRAGAVQALVRGGYFNERRGNGTPAQLNATITRWGAAGAHGLALGGAWEARGDVSANDYRQTFSAVAASRATERLTALQWVGSTGAGGAFSWARETARTRTIVSATLRHAGADLDEASISVAGVQAPVRRTPARQRGGGIVLQERVELTPRISIDGGLRVDRWSLTELNGAAPSSSFVFAAPRAGATFDLLHGRTLRVSWLSGFRTPTINELYRSFRVGNTNTQANPLLQPEESQGPEVAFTFARDRWTARAIAYAARLNGAIYNRTISSSATAIVRERSNGDARAIGSELEIEVRAARGVTLTTAWAFNDSTFTSGELDGRRVPQVPRVSGSVGLRAVAGRLAAAATVRVLGAQFDDDRNDFTLRRGALADARAGWRLSRRAEIFGAVENVLDAELDTGRTPIRTVGAPRAARAGLAVRF